MMKDYLTTLCVLFMLVTGSASVAAGSNRIALLIGNEGYSREVGPLTNPHNDVELVGASLVKLGFQVEVLRDASYRRMDIAIRRYVDRVRLAGAEAIGFLYYSGHGIANPQTKQNFLVPVDATSANSSRIWYESFLQDEIIRRIAKQSSNATHFVVFDSCRNELNVTGGAAKSLGSSKGFLPVERTTGVLIAYATAPGKTASDRGRYSGPYASALASELLRPGVEAVTMFRNVQIKVKATTGQNPWLSLPALPAVYLAGRLGPDSHSKAEPGLATPQNAQAMLRRQFEREYWFSVRDSGDPALVGSFLQQFPNGSFAPLARTLRDQLEQQSRPGHSEASLREATDYATEIQRLLKQGGCYLGDVDGNWGQGSQRALRRALGDKLASAGATAGVLQHLSKVRPTCRASVRKSKQPSTKSSSKGTARTSSSTATNSNPSQCIQDCRLAGGRACASACKKW